MLGWPDPQRLAFTKKSPPTQILSQGGLNHGRESRWSLLSVQIVFYGFRQVVRQGHGGSFHVPIITFESVKMVMMVNKMILVTYS
jgi:hypothetical protein